MEIDMTREEAIERIKYSIEKQAWALDENDTEALYEVIPELRESEDEKIRKEIVSFIRAFWVDHRDSVPQASKWLDWLEKQKEQKPVHFELKAGKWYICHRAFCCRADHLTVKEGERFQCEKDGIVKGFVIKEPEKYFKECSAPAPMEDEQKEQKPADDKAFEEWVDGWWEEHKDKAYHEVTMDKKEFKNFCRGIRNMCQYNSEWSEEDEAIYDSIIREIVDKDMAMTNLQKRWLKSLKNRGNFPKSNTNSSCWKPSKDEERLINTTISFLKDFADKGYENAVECIDFLKSKLNGNTCE